MLINKLTDIIVLDNKIVNYSNNVYTNHACANTTNENNIIIKLHKPVGNYF